jgi:hypothetical protein
VNAGELDRASIATTVDKPSDAAHAVDGANLKSLNGAAFDAFARGNVSRAWIRGDERCPRTQSKPQCDCERDADCELSNSSIHASCRALHAAIRQQNAPPAHRRSLTRAEHQGKELCGCGDSS